MSQLDNILDALDEALAFTSGEQVNGQVLEVDRPELDVRQIREQAGMGPEEFAEEFRFPVRMIQEWEQDISQPEGPLRAYLMVIKHDWEAVHHILQEDREQYELREVAAPKPA